MPVVSVGASTGGGRRAAPAGAAGKVLRQASARAAIAMVCVGGGLHEHDEVVVPKRAGPARNEPVGSCLGRGRGTTGGPVRPGSLVGPGSGRAARMAIYRCK